MQAQATDRLQVATPEAARIQRSEEGGPFLAPIERPPGLIPKIVFFFVRRQLGKVVTPLKVFAARMPAAFGSFHGKVSQLDKKLRLPPKTVALIRQQVAGTNACLFCMDASRWHATTQLGDAPRIDALSEREICDLVWLVASEHLFNITNIGLNIGSDGLCDASSRGGRVTAS
jgi:hypothetical protein